MPFRFDRLPRTGTIGKKKPVLINHQHLKSNWSNSNVWCTPFAVHVIMRAISPRIHNQFPKIEWLNLNRIVAKSIQPIPPFQAVEWIPVAPFLILNRKIPIRQWCIERASEPFDIHIIAQIDSIALQSMWFVYHLFVCPAMAAMNKSIYFIDILQNPKRCPFEYIWAGKFSSPDFFQ